MTDSKRTPVGKFIHTTWGNLNVRCGNGLYKSDSKKNKCYENVLIEFSRDQFCIWCYDNKELIKSLKKPSIDRIDVSGNYSIENIRIIELDENIRKDKLISSDGNTVCVTCKESKPLSEFAKDKRVSIGVRTLCKSCDSARGCARYKKAKLSSGK
jgi:hypothetical protein